MQLEIEYTQKPCNLEIYDSDQASQKSDKSDVKGHDEDRFNESEQPVLYSILPLEKYNFAFRFFHLLQRDGCFTAVAHLAVSFPL